MNTYFARAGGYFEILEILLTPQVPRRFVVNTPHLQTAAPVL